MTTSDRSLNVARGTNDKPAATGALVEDLIEQGYEGHLLIGYPVMATPDGPYTIDALLVSPQAGLVCFDLIEGPDPGDFKARQDDAYNTLRARLLTHRELIDNRDLQTPIHTLSFAPALVIPPSSAYHLVLNSDSLSAAIAPLEWPQVTPRLYDQTLSAIHSMTAIRRSRRPRGIHNPDSRGAKLAAIEASIATLDRRQSQAVIETVDGVQRIRGIAGSGKTIVLALKAAYLHAQHPDWRMAVTFNTRSLKDQFSRLINKFTIEQTGEEPDWDRLRIINAWGAPGPPDRDGIYYEFCRTHDVQYLNFNAARIKYGLANAFNGAVSQSLKLVSDPLPLYDVILIDEAQDFSPAFLHLCYEILNQPKRLVYAYDELQNLTNTGLPPVEEIFGSKNGQPRVTLNSRPNGLRASQDIILEKCYRNSRPALVTAHGLGFGIYREKPKNSTTRLVQMFGQPELWTDIGYKVKQGRLSLGDDVTLIRTSDSSPEFLETHSPIDDLIVFKEFEDEQSQATWVAKQIETDLGRGELRHDDIIVINTNPITARSKLGTLRNALMDRGIVSHVAGVDTLPDVFFNPESITCTGIFRAKGNEAAMVYVINGNECQTSAANLSLVRNRLFTAITRSKAWVRVTGIGDSMRQLMSEYHRLRDAHFELAFRYPTQAELTKLTIVHRDMSHAEERKVRNRQQSLSGLIEDLRQGVLFLDDFDEQDIDDLRHLLSQVGVGT